MSKKLLSRIPLGILTAVVALTIGVVPALAHHPDGGQSASCEAGYNVFGNYSGGSSYKWLEWDVDVVVGGTQVENIVGSWNGVNPGFAIFNESGPADGQVDITGFIKMFGNVHTNAVSEDTDTITRSSDYNSDGSFNADIDFHNSNGDVEIDADAGYVITFVGVDYADSDANDVTFAPNTASFDYDAPGSNDIEHVTVTVFRAAVPESNVKGALEQTFTYNFHKTLDCYQTCDESVATEPVITYGDWSDWVYNPETGLFERTRTVTTTIIYVDAEDGQTECDRDVNEDTEKETKEPGSEVIYWGVADCEAWTIWGQEIGEGDAPDGDPYVASSGGWVNPFVLESAQDFGVTVYEPESCLDEPGDPYTDCTGVWFFNVETQGYVLVYEWKDSDSQESTIIDEVTYWEPRECVEKQCESETLGWLFHLVGPEGQTCDLASYQINPNTGRWAIPNVGAQQKCCGFIAENIPSGREIVVGCNGKVNIICTRCTGGGPPIAYGDD